MTIGIGSEKKEKAVEMVMAIRRCFERPRFQYVFGDLRGEIWTKDALSFKGAKLQEKEPNIMAFGMDSSAVASHHFKKLVVDDPSTFENTRTWYIRDQMWKRFLSDVLPCLEPEASKKVVRLMGTRYDPDDLHGRNIRNAFIHGVPLEVRREMTLLDDGSSFWEEKFPVEIMKHQQRLNPAIFALQYQNDVKQISEQKAIRQAWIKPYRYSELDRLGLYKIMAIDPGGITEKEENSGMGIVLLGASTRPGATFGLVYLLQSEFVHADTWTEARMVLDIYEKEKPNRIVVEEVGLQKVFQHVFEEEGRKRNLPYLPIYGMPMAEIKDKITLARSVTHMFTQGQVHIDEEQTPTLYGKLEDYPNPGTDDVNAFLIGLLDLKLNWMKNLNVNKKEQKRQESLVTHFSQGVKGRV